MSNLKFKKEDLVKVISGKERGKKGKVLVVFPEENQLIVERLNMIKRHTKAKQQENNTNKEKTKQKQKQQQKNNKTKTTTRTKAQTITKNENTHKKRQNTTNTNKLQQNTEHHYKSI